MSSQSEPQYTLIADPGEGYAPFGRVEVRMTETEAFRFRAESIALAVNASQQIEGEPGLGFEEFDALVDEGVRIQHAQKVGKTT